MIATHLLRHLKEPITRKIVFLVVLLFGALGLLLAQHHVAHVYTSRCQEALDNQHAKRSLGWIIRKRLVQAETALHQLAAEDDARNVRVLHDHIAQRVTSIERALTVLSNGGMYEYVIHTNFENIDEFRETISYAKDESEGFVIEVVELVPKLVDLECNVEALADAVRKRIVAEDDTGRQALSDMIALRRKQAEATLLRCGETSNKIHRDTSQELAAIERRRMDLASRVRLAEYAAAGILGLLCVVVAGITLRQVAGILEERKGLLGDLRKHHDHLDELVTERTAALSKTNEQLQQEVTERKQAEEALQESEGRLKALLNANPTGIVVIDVETHEIVDANSAAIEMIGAARGQVLGRECHKYICPAGLGQCPITDLGQEVDNAERVLIRADGEEVPILKTIVPIVLDGRECLLESFIDITKRRRAEEALKESQQYTRALVEAHLDPLVTISAEGKIMDVNHATELVTGYPRKRLVGTDFSDYFTNPDKARQGYQLVFKDKQVRGYPLDIKHHGGSVTPVLYNASVYHDINGDVAGVFAAARDITDIKRAEEKLQESEKRHRAITETAQDAVITADAEGNIRFWNAAAEKIFGFTAAEAVGKNMMDLIVPPAYHEAKRKGLAEFTRTGRGAAIGNTLELIAQRKDGAKFPVEISLSAYKGADGFMAVALVRDITTRNRAKAELQRAHAETKQLFEAISSVLIGVDGEGKVTAWNATAERTFGIEKDNAVGRLFDDLGIQWDHAVIAECISQCRAAKRPIRLEEVRFKRPDGRDGFLGMTLNPLNGGSERRGGFLLVATDITEQKVLQGQLAQSQKLESIGQLAAGIAHEINTPIQYVGDNVRFLSDSMDDLLGLIGSYRNLISEIAKGAGEEDCVSKAATLEQKADLPYLKEEVPKSIEQSLDGVGRVSKIVRAMKDFSHPGAEGMEAVDLNKAIESTITVARNEWKYVAEMVTKFDPALPPVPCLAGDLNQVVLNIVINAAHAIADVVGKNTGEKGTITVATRHDSGWAEIRISDTGTGIPEEHRSKVFDHFFTTKEVGKGTGQGLAIAHAVVTEKHNGTITLESEMGKGTTFIIRLPIEPEAAAVETPQHEEAHSFR